MDIFGVGSGLSGERSAFVCVLCVFVWRGMKGVVVGWRMVEEEGGGRGKRDWLIVFDKVLEELEESGSVVIGRYGSQRNE